MTTNVMMLVLVLVLTVGVVLWEIAKREEGLVSIAKEVISGEAVLDFSDRSQTDFDFEIHLRAISILKFSLSISKLHREVGKRKAATKADKGGKSQAKKGKLAKKDPNKPKRPPIKILVSQAKHGTRATTKEKLKELNDLAMHMEVLLQDAKEQKLALQKVPAWFRGWKSPWQGKLKGGELISEGEDELYNLGVRTRDKFPQLFNEDYHPDVYAIKATQIPRASASAVAFGMGLLSGRGNLGPGSNQAFAVTSESRASDILLRFHDCCQNYKAYRKSQEPSVLKLKEPALDEITHALVGRYNLNFTRQDISSLWVLCKQEASLLNITDQACALFTPSEVVLLEWTDDLELFILKGYGNALNYQMGVPLLEDVVQSMEQAIMAKEEEHAPGCYEKARLQVAHAETLLPFSCLIGLFLEESDFEKIEKEQPLQLPPKPPQRRNWRGSVAAPFGWQ
ncbi:hypothetical protein ACSBR2_014685 [Camellia fascicularis]